MVRPARFAFNEETAQNNYFQQASDSNSVSEKALEEFDSFVRLLQANDVDLTVVQDSPEPWTPDSLFPNNWFTSHVTGELVLYPMYAPNRRNERKREVLELLRRKMNHRKLVDLTHWEEENEFLEGTGSMIFDRDRRVAYCCRSPRTSEKVLAEFCSRMNYDAVLFNAVDAQGHAIYHTNVMMALGEAFAVVCLSAIDDLTERAALVKELQGDGKEIIDVTEDQINNFAGNEIELCNADGKRFTIMTKATYDCLTPEQRAVIEKTSEIISPDVKTIETYGGGSVRCMISEIFL